MPTYPVRCPRCDADLTVGREMLNRPAACGACGRAFVPILDPTGPEPDDLPAAKPKTGGGAVFGILALVLGVVSLPLCCCGTLPLVIGGGAVVSGLIGLTRRDGRVLSVIGLLCGLLGIGFRLGGYLFGANYRGFDPF